jgi:hypothetical protein
MHYHNYHFQTLIMTKNATPYMMREIGYSGLSVNKKMASRDYYEWLREQEEALINIVNGFGYDCVRL